MTEQESMVISEANSVPGLTIQVRFDSEHFKIWRFFVVDEWDVRTPREKDGKYERTNIVRSYIAVVTGANSGGTVLEMIQICQETGGFRHFSVPENQYRHGYWGLTPAKIIKEGENSDGELQFGAFE